MNQKGDNGYGGINYYYDVPTNAEFVIFSNGDGSDQTVNVPFSTDVTGWYPTEEKDAEGHWQVESWREDNPDQPGGTRQTAPDRSSSPITRAGDRFISTIGAAPPATPSGRAQP